MENWDKVNELLKDISLSVGHETALNYQDVYTERKLIEKLASINEKCYLKEHLSRKDKADENKNILEHANDIVFKRSEEKERQYGDFTESVERTSKFASLLTNTEISTKQAFGILVSLKISRLAYNHKYDTVLDALTYLTAYHNYLKNK